MHVNKLAFECRRVRVMIKQVLQIEFGGKLSRDKIIRHNMQL